MHPPTPNSCFCSTPTLGGFVWTEWHLNIDSIPYIILLCGAKSARWVGDTHPFKSGFELERCLTLSTVTILSILVSGVGAGESSILNGVGAFRDGANFTVVLVFGAKAITITEEWVLTVMTPATRALYSNSIGDRRSCSP